MQTRHKPDEIFETFRLLDYFWRHDNFNRRKFEQEFKDCHLGSASKEILDRWYPIYENYLLTFHQGLSFQEGDSFFFEGDREQSEPLAEACGFLLLTRRHLLEDLEQRPEEEIYQMMCEQLFELVPENLEGVMELLQDKKYTPASCWKWLLLLKEPKAYLTRFIHLIQRHLPAQKKAWKAVAGLLKTQLKTFEVHPKVYDSVPNFQEHVQESFPSLIIFNSYVIRGNSKVINCYAGLMANEIMGRQMETPPKEELAGALKLMGDASKFEILHLLKDHPRYNIEIAEHLKVTAATASHHMNNLLSGDFVIADKREGKVFYSLKKEKIQEIITSLEQSLLS